MKEVKVHTYFELIGLFVLYSFSGVFTKQASMKDFLSLEYLCYLLGVVVILGTYTIFWQQIIKKMPISDAYMFKGTTIVFTMLIAALIFGETITLTNIIGSVIIIGGIALFAKA